ncbi:MAG: hypothetical protein ABFE07_28055 [Armatimonadia bacterium]
MELKEFAKERVKKAGLLKQVTLGTRRVWGGLTGSTVKGIEQRMGEAAGDMTTSAQNRLGNLGKRLPKAKAFQRNVRIGAGVAGGAFLAGRMSKRDNE